MTAIATMALRRQTTLKAACLAATLMFGVQAPASAQGAGETAAEAAAPQETALSIPRPNAAPALAGMPQPLAPSDAVRLRRIFDYQARGEITAAIRETERLEDRRLMGHVLADRWLRGGHGHANPTAAELIAWINENPDNPDAPSIQALLQSKAPAAAVPSVSEGESLAQGDEDVPEERDNGARPWRRQASLDRAVRDRAYDGDVAGAMAAIAKGKAEPAYAAVLQGEVALALFHQGRDEEAWRLAADAAQRAPNEAHPSFVAGLAAWGLGRYDVAMRHFEASARADSGTPALRAAAAFWTARAAIHARQPRLYLPWMLQASQEPRTFYGLVARRLLGLAPGFAWEREVPGAAEAAALAETAGGWRALALLQIGQRDRAEAELRRLYSVARGNPGMLRAMLAVSTQSGMTELASQLATVVQDADGRPRDFARFPLPPLMPQGGYRIDPAVLYAIARQESNFNERAVSGAGARGLMQIMPATASYVLGDRSLRTSKGARRLNDPALSLELAQRYLLHLSSLDSVGDDLIRVLAAYNNGPGNLSRWLPGARHQGDPFLFIESIPVNETRAYVQRVLAYSWIYASRLGLPSPSLEALAAGGFPRFSATAGLETVMQAAGARR